MSICHDKSIYGGSTARNGFFGYGRRLESNARNISGSAAAVPISNFKKLVSDDSGQGKSKSVETKVIASY